MKLFDIDEEIENKDFDCSYSWSDMANALIDHNIPHEVLRILPDLFLTKLKRRPILDMFKFDDWLHNQYGDYESEGETMQSMFKKLFGDDSDKIAYYFGIEK